MQFHQQLCGKNVKGAINAASQRPRSSSSGTSEKRGITADELEALRIEVYGGGRPRSAGPASATPRAASPTERTTQASAPSRASGWDQRPGGAPPLPATSPRTPQQARRADGTAQDYGVPASGADLRRPAVGRHPEPALGGVSETAELRGMLQRLTDDVRRLRDEVVFLKRENEGLRDAVAECWPQGAPRQQHDDTQELWRAVDRLSVQLSELQQDQAAFQQGAAAHQAPQLQFAGRRDAQRGAPASTATPTVRTRGAGSEVTDGRRRRDPAEFSPPHAAEPMAGDASGTATTIAQPNALYVYGRQGRQHPRSSRDETAGRNELRRDTLYESRDRSASSEYPDVTVLPTHSSSLLDVSLRKDTQNLVAQVMQRQRPPAANYTSRSSSRASESSSGMDGFLGRDGGSEITFPRRRTRN
jgi:hypothetical protein